MSTISHELPARASVRRAQRTAKTRALDGLALAWADIDASPSWLALPGADVRDCWSIGVGAWWLAASWKACIDGKRLAKVRNLLGERFLTRLHESSDAQYLDLLHQAPRPLLPAAQDLPAHLLACGRALLGWSLPPHLSAPVSQHLGWREEERHDAVFEAHAAWARYALETARQPANWPVALNPQPETAKG
jgi:hypothetical protein